MKTAVTIILAIGIVVLCVVPVIATDYTFTGNGAAEGDWKERLNWEDSFGDNQVPLNGDSATIPDGKFCNVHDIVGGAVCDWIDVQTGGELRIYKGNTLTIDEDSTVDGIVRIGYNGDPGSLLIAADLTIEGDAGEIVMTDGVIDDNGGLPYRLTIKKTPGNPGCDPTAPSCSLWVRGGGSDIKVTLTNDAFVIPDGTGQGCTCSGSASVITLSDNPKNGSGVWGAKDTGHLQVDAEVTGDGTWRMIDEDGDCACAAKITFNHCASVTGDVNLEVGTFIVNQNFCTTGDLTWKSEALTGGGDSIATIDVAADKAAKFGFAGCLSPCQ